MTGLNRAVLIPVFLIVICTGAASAARVGSPAGDEPAAGTLEVTFAFNKAGGVVPSCRIAVWLETAGGKPVKTLFVSEYPSGRGFNRRGLRPARVEPANRDKAEESEFDTVTRPTPPVGANTLTFDCRALETRLAHLAGPHALCRARPGCRGGGFA